MNKKLIIIIAVFAAVVVGICVGFISNNNKKVEEQNTNENLANINIVKPSTVENNNVDESNNNVIKNESNTMIAENFIQETNNNKVTQKDNNQNQHKDMTTDVSDQVSVVPYAMTEDEIKEVNNGNSHTFIGTVITINDRAVFVKPDDSYIQEYGSKVSIDKADFGNGLELNDRVEITFIGGITKTYPGSIHVVSIKKIN